MQVNWADVCGHRMFNVVGPLSHPGAPLARNRASSFEIDLEDLGSFNYKSRIRIYQRLYQKNGGELPVPQPVEKYSKYILVQKIIA